MLTIVPRRYARLQTPLTLSSIKSLFLSFSLFSFLIHISVIFSWPSLPFFRIMFWVLLFSNILGSENQSDDDEFPEEMNRSHANCILLQR